MEQFTAVFGDSFQHIFPKVLIFSPTDKYFSESEHGRICSYKNEMQVINEVIMFSYLLPWLFENPQDDKMKEYIYENYSE